MSPRLDVRGMSTRDAATQRAARRGAEALEALAPGARRAHLVFTDDNGPKGGPAIRCAVTLTLPRHGPIHVEARGISATRALDGALTRLRRRLGRTIATARGARRRPKKYYAARALTG